MRARHSYARWADDNEADQISLAVRWGGTVFPACALAFIATILLYVIGYGQPAKTSAGGEVTLGNAAAHVMDRWKFISKIWMAEASAWGPMAVAAFVLHIDGD